MLFGTASEITTIADFSFSLSSTVFLSTALKSATCAKSDFP